MSLKNSDNFITNRIMLSVDDRTRHWLYLYEIPRSEMERSSSIHDVDMGGSTVSVEQKIYDGRDNDALTLDDASFELVNCPTTLSNEEFYKLQSGNDELTKKYYSEVEEFVMKRLDCDKVICVHSQVRNASKVGKDHGGVQGYAGGGPHTDSSPVSGDVFALDILSSKDDEKSNEYQRYCYLNLWRNIGDQPIEDNHLALLDERTVVKPDDYIPRDIMVDGFDAVQYGLNARHASQHKWYYFPKMTKDEGILFKQMDSDWTKSGRICFHMSVTDPTAPSKNSRDRESIEVRMLCLWKHATVNSMPTNDNIHRDMLKNPKEYAIELKGNNNNNNNLSSASTLQLILAILSKLPWVGGLFLQILGALNYSSSVADNNNNNQEYTGNPNDYLIRFVSAINAFDVWPAFGKNWAKSTMKRGKDAQDGIQIITKALVDDQMGYQKTKKLSKDAKAEIVNYLLSNDDFMQVCQKHLVPLLLDEK